MGKGRKGGRGVRKEEANTCLLNVNDGIQSLRMMLSILKDVRAFELREVEETLRKEIAFQQNKKEVIAQEWEKNCRFFFLNTEGKKIPCEYHTKGVGNKHEVWILRRLTVETIFFESLTVSDTFLKRI